MSTVALNAHTFEEAVSGHHFSFRTTCGREIRIGHLILGGGRHPAQRVSLRISAASATDDGIWAGFTPGEARQLAADLLLQAAACEARARETT